MSISRNEAPQVSATPVSISQSRGAKTASTSCCLRSTAMRRVALTLGQRCGRRVHDIGAATAWRARRRTSRIARASRRTPSSSSGGSSSENESRNDVCERRSTVTAPPGVKVTPHAGRLGVQRALVERAVKRDPEVVAALGRIDVVLAGHVSLQRGQQRVAALTVEGDRAGDVAVVGARREPAGRHVLDQRGRVEVGLELEHRDPLAHGAARRDPAAAQAAADHLRQRVRVDDVPGRQLRAPGAAARPRSTCRRRRGPPGRRSCAPSPARRGARGAPRRGCGRSGCGRRSGARPASPRDG